MVCLTMGYPKLEDESEILRRKQGGDPLEQVQKVVGTEDFIHAVGGGTYPSSLSSLYDYIARLTAANLAKNLSSVWVASPRGFQCIDQADGTGCRLS